MNNLCSDTTTCQAMKQALTSNTPKGKGIVAISYMDLVTGNDSGRLIVYRMKAEAKNKWLCFRVCPFCTQPINQWMLAREDQK